MLTPRSKKKQAKDPDDTPKTSSGYPRKDADTLARHLRSYRALLETMEVRGELDTGLPIDGSSNRSYSSTIDDSIEFVEQHTDNDAHASLTEVRAAVEDALEGVSLILSRTRSEDTSGMMSAQSIADIVVKKLSTD